MTGAKQTQIPFGNDKQEKQGLEGGLAEGGEELKVEQDPGEGISLEAGGSTEKYLRILEAAVEVIAKNGYFNSPISAIAARAGVADGTVYLYFKSKDEILRTAIDRNIGRFRREVMELMAVERDPRAQLEAIAQAHLETSTTNRSMAILMQTELRQSAKFIAEFSHRHLVTYIQVVREVVRRGQAEGVFRKDISDAIVAHCMFGAIDELLSSSVFTGRVYDAKATAMQVIDVLLSGISAGASETKPAADAHG